MRRTCALLMIFLLVNFASGVIYAGEQDNESNQLITITESKNLSGNEGGIRDCPTTPPVVECPDLPDIMLCAPEEVELSGFSVTDAENDVVTIESSIGFYSEGSVFFTPAEPGEYEIVLTATDATGFIVSCTTGVVVYFNSAPACNVPENTVIVQCTPTEVCIPVDASDPDGNLSGCSVISGPGEIVDGNWCYTPTGDETVDVTIECSDECQASCQSSFSIEFVMQEHWAVITMDRTGSMALTNAFGESRLMRAKEQAHIEIDKLLDMNDPDYPGVFTVAVFYFNSTGGVVFAQDFTPDAATLHDAIDAIPEPRHDTPLAAAMCQSHCQMPILDGQCVRYVITFTDGLENASQEEDICELCTDCNEYMETGWNYDCDPASPSTCTDWQLCLADKFAQSGINLMHYFGNPINPFSKGVVDGLEDMYFLKYTAEESSGQFIYHSDLEEICADVNNDGRVNVSDAICIINYVFVPGSPAPVPLEAADANWDGSVNVSDAATVINYVFMGAPAPTCALQQ